MNLGPVTPAVLVLAGAFLVLANTAPWIVQHALGSTTERDVFRPQNVLAGLGLLGTVYLFMLPWDLSLRTEELQVTPWVRDFDGAVVQYAILTAMGFYLMLAGAASSAARGLARRIPSLPDRNFTPARCTIAIVVAFVVGILVYLYYLRRIGGLLNLWLALYNRAVVSAGLGYIYYVYSLLLPAAVALLTYSLRYTRSKIHAAVSLLALLLVAAILGSTGGRFGIVALIALSIMIVHYCNRRFRTIVTPRTLAFGALIFAVMVVLPLFRPEGAFEKYRANPPLLVEDAAGKISRVAPQFSMMDRTVIMLSYFTPERLWWGRSYLDLLYAPIPRTRFPNKPPVDDGVYFTEIIAGRVLSPSKPAREVSVSSSPMGSWVPYMNFGFPGWVVGMLLIGVVIGAAYEYMRLSAFSPYSVYLYQFVILGGFSLSNYALVNFATTVVVLSGFFWLFFGRAPGRWRGTQSAVSRLPAHAS